MTLELKTIIKRQPWWYTISDNAIYQKVKNGTRYSSFLKEIDFYKSFLGTSNKLIFDVGAHVGTKSKIFSLLSEKVVLFEPDQENLKILHARLKENKKCVIVGCALSSKQGVADYYSIANDSAYNSLSEKHLDTVVKSRGIIDKKYGLTQCQVNTNTLDFFINAYGMPDYIKIDVEGYEKEVILGLHTVVPKISFEANLPQFIPETIDTISYLDKLSKGKYRFNYTIGSHFELADFVTAPKLINELSAIPVKSIEVYCFLKSAVVIDKVQTDK